MIKTLLIADDESDLREILRLEFEALNWNVLEAENGTVALKLLLANNIDVVITDVRMPGGSGIQLLENIKLQNKNIPVLVITGFTDVLEQEALAKGAFKIIKKPFNLNQVLEIVKASIHN